MTRTTTSSFAAAISLAALGAPGAVGARHAGAPGRARRTTPDDDLDIER